jgi:hypothetical protein
MSSTGEGSESILGVLVAPGEVMENQPMIDLLWRVRFRWKLRPRQVTGDTKYGTIPNIRVVEGMGIRAYVPLPDRRGGPRLGGGRSGAGIRHHGGASHLASAPGTVAGTRADGLRVRGKECMHG